MQDIVCCCIIGERALQFANISSLRIYSYIIQEGSLISYIQPHTQVILLPQIDHQGQ